MEVLSLNPGTDIDYRNGELKLLTLKQKRITDKVGKHKKQRAPSRIVPVASNVIAEISNYRVQVSQYIDKGEVAKAEINPFKLNPATFRKMFYRLARRQVFLKIWAIRTFFATRTASSCCERGSR
jgi:molybdate transport system regulatory protein